MIGVTPYDPSTPLVLDKSILYWVLLPIFVVMFLQGIFRQYIAVLMKDDKVVGTTLSLSSAKDQLDLMQRNSMLARSRRLRINGAYIPVSGVVVRKKFYAGAAFKHAIDGQSGGGQQDGDGENKADAAPAQDPAAMMGMMKQNVSNMLPNMLLMGWCNYFFNGFVTVKLPFVLSDRLKQMLQRGIMLTNLDSTYVSSISWYFLLLFGLRGVFTLVLGEGSAANNTDVQMMQMSGQGAPGAPPPDFNKIFAQEKVELELMNVQSDEAGDSAQRRLLQAT